MCKYSIKGSYLLVPLSLPSTEAAPDPAKTTGDALVPRATTAIAREDPDRATVGNVGAVTKATPHVDSDQFRT